MKELIMFMLPTCPHCQLAFKCQDELMAENPAYKENISIRMVNEEEWPEDLTGNFDYYYVPTYYYNGEKLFEGHVEKEDVDAVLKKVLEA